MSRIKLRCIDGEVFEVEKKVVRMSVVLRELLEDVNSEEGSPPVVPLPVPYATGPILAMVLDYCQKHHEPCPDHDAAGWDEEFMGRFDRVNFPELLEFLNLVSYLDIGSLLSLGTKKAADMIKDMSVEEVRWIFKVHNDYTPDEENALRSLYASAFRS